MIKKNLLLSFIILLLYGTPAFAGTGEGWIIAAIAVYGFFILFFIFIVIIIIALFRNYKNRNKKHLESQQNEKEVILKRAYEKGICPECGESLDKNLTKCLACGFNFYENSFIK